MIAENKKTQVTKPSVSREIQVTPVMPVISDLVVYNRSVQSSVVVFPSAFSFVRKHIGVVRWVGIKSMICSGMRAISTVLLSTFIAMILHQNDVKSSSLRTNERCYGDQAQSNWPLFDGTLFLI